MCYLPSPGVKHEFPASAGGFLPTVPPGKSVSFYSVLEKDWATEEQSWRFQDIEQNLKTEVASGNQETLTLQASGGFGVR